MKKLLLSLATFCSLFLMVSCANESVNVKDLEGKWLITNVQGKTIKQAGTAQMTFDMKQNKLHGNGGCNIFNTKIELDDTDVSALRFSHPAATLMDCPDAEQERAILQSLDAVRSIKRGTAETEMILLDANKKSLLTLQKQ